MDIWMILGIIFALVFFTVSVTSFVCFFMTFYVPKYIKPKERTKITAPVVDGFAPFRPQIGEWMREVEGLKSKHFEITSFDGLRLCATYYEYEKGAPIEIMFHGYRGNARRDLSGGVIRAFRQGRSTLIVDHRACGGSQGRVVSFGINESRDCRMWIDLVLREIDPDAKVILTGISMGAATVLITAGRDDLPKNVCAVLADCGYTSCEEIIKNTMKDMGLPKDILYPFVRLGAGIFGGFDIDEFSPVEAMKKCRLPVVFIHGDADSFVPYSMSIRNYEACGAEVKKLVTIEGANHGVAYPYDPEKYLAEIGEFFDRVL